MTNVIKLSDILDDWEIIDRNDLYQIWINQTVTFLKISDILDDWE